MEARLRVLRALGIASLLLSVSCGPQTRAAGPEDLPSGLLPNGDLALAVRLSEDCVDQGQELTADAKTTASASVRFIASYPHLGADPQQNEVIADGKGRARWTWDTPAGILPGAAVLLVEASQGDRESQYIYPFRLGGC